ncbi:MAG: PIG-L family deacetylase [Saprospiraceae bacterium]|nr:PIG-L family deacetylase [Saprospiraceae bacterium]
MKTIIIEIFLICCLGISHSIAQDSVNERNAADIYQSIKKLNFLGSVLYVAAHPDDENTALIAWLANKKLANTTYISLTRGDGGQNLIGNELFELLGVLRTQELLMARSVDGGNQAFTRANDFGFSKSPFETLGLWDKEKVLSDLIWMIRKTEPDVIINRFPNDPNADTHGHHIASAMLSYEAFDLVSDPNFCKEQLQYVNNWHPTRLLFNTSPWFYSNSTDFDKEDKSKMLVIDIGAYLPSQGKSINEIAAESRSMHKCQAFGSASSRGNNLDYFKLLKGSFPENNDMFYGINTTWSRVKGSEGIENMINEIIKKYDFDAPYKSVPALTKVRERLLTLPRSHWRDIKLSECEMIIKNCLGLFLEVTTSEQYASASEEVELNVECINRSPLDVKLLKITILPLGIDSTLNINMLENKDYKWKTKTHLPSDAKYTNAYWLQEPWDANMYQVSDQQLRGLATTPHQEKVNFEIVINSDTILFPVDWVFKKVDPAKGEIYSPFEVTPPVFLSFNEKIQLFRPNETKKIMLNIKAASPNVQGEISLYFPKQWKVIPSQIPFTINKKNEEYNIEVSITAPNERSECELKVMAKVDGKLIDSEVSIINYDHIPTQTVLRPCKSKLICEDIAIVGKKIGYVMGAGDQVPKAIMQMGYEVEILNANNLNPQYLSQFDAIVTGVRAYNVLESLSLKHKVLMDYVEQGGTLIVQYNTNTKTTSPNLGPYPFELGKKRTTDEHAVVTFLNPNHPILNTPNKITEADFDNWVQERAIYFPINWDEHYETVIACNDSNESPNDSGILVASYGKGKYIYTSYSWFRELPAGVVGAYRIFANMLSYR